MCVKMYMSTCNYLCKHMEEDRNKNIVNNLKKLENNLKTSKNNGSTVLGQVIVLQSFRLI